MNRTCEAPLGLDPMAVRSSASSLSRRGAEVADAATRVRPFNGWRGPGGDAATQARQAAADRGHAFAASMELAAAALRTCADALEDVARLRTRSMALVQEDTQVQQAAERARAMLRAATTTGPPLPLYAWDSSTPLLVAAARLAAEANELEAEAVQRAVAALDQIRPARPRQRSARDHLVGFGRGAWTGLVDTATLLRLASLDAVAADPVGWWHEIRAHAEGAAHMARRPRDGFVSVVGWDQLQAGAYGEWLGAMAAGSFPPAARGARVLGAARLVDAGGPVRLRRGIVVPAGFPTRIADLEPDRRVHILDGDRRGGGHRSGVGRPDKSEFPPSWTDDDIIERVMLTATSPDRVVPQRGGRFKVFGEHNGVRIKVIVEADGRVVSGFPLDGPGVVRNPKVPA